MLLNNQLKREINIIPVIGFCEYGNELQGSIKDRYSCPAKQLFASQIGLCSIKLVTNLDLKTFILQQH
jgi:hypothetical protein